MLLFQYNGEVAVCSMMIGDDHLSESAKGFAQEGYCGYYLFEKDSTIIFSKPIIKEDLFKITGSFKSFNQSAQKIDIKHLDAINKMIIERLVSSYLGKNN